MQNWLKLQNGQNRLEITFQNDLYMLFVQNEHGSMGSTLIYRELIKLKDLIERKHTVEYLENQLSIIKCSYEESPTEKNLVCIIINNIVITLTSLQIEILCEFLDSMNG